MASATTDLLIGKIVGILENEASAIAGVGDQVDEIKQELLYMKSFLHDADGKEPHTEGEKALVTMVRNLAFKAEVIIEKFMYDMYEQQSRGRLARWLHKPIHIPKFLWHRRQFAHELQKITRMIKAIPERNQRYCVGGAIQGTSSTCNDNHKWVKNRAESSLFIQEEELVGIESKKQTLMGWLMNEEQHQMVVSVVGMGGSGKSTLVAKTFIDETIRRHFDCCAWITVSQAYVIEDLFRSLIKEFHRSRKEEVPRAMKSLEHTELVKMLLNYLDGKRYLVVLDDVWDIKLWEKVRISLPDRALGNRIMLTTRIEDIALHAFGVESRVYRIALLEKNEAWELFNKKAFSNYHKKCCPPEFESLASQVAEKCEGLPLAIVALSGVLSCKESPTEWSKVYSSLNWQLTHNPLLKPVMSILLLSFHDLPYQLKHCFMYCSLFPENYSMDRKRLIRLWLAEGFIDKVDGLTPEEVAESSLIELIRRSMLKVGGTSETGRPQKCKMHDLLRNVAIQMSKKEMFSANYVGREMTNVTARRLSIETTKGEMSSITGLSQLRSFLVFVTDTLSLCFSETLPSGFKLLKVLDLEEVPIDKLPSELVYLFNLRYLNLRRTPIKELPKAIGRLQNLETLDISHTKIEVLPRGISKLLNLRHLIMHRYTSDFIAFTYVKGIRAPPDIGKLKKLQVLSGFESEGNITRVVGSMTQLLRIGFTNIKGRDEIELCDSIQKMKQLRNLTLMATDAEEFLQVEKISSPPPHLHNVTLAGKLHKVPEWVCSLGSLTRLCLHWSRLGNELLPQIEALPCLASLVLVNAYVGKELHFGEGFAKLSILSLSNFPSLSKITIEKGVMPNLKSLSLNSCIELKTLPLGIEFLLNLRTLELEFLPTQLIDSIREGGVDRPKVQHIPEINNYYTTSSGRFYKSLSYI